MKKEINGHGIRKPSDKRTKELFVRVEERINIRKALTLKNACTYAKYVDFNKDSSPSCKS